MERSLEEEYQKHNCEIRKIRKFIRKKGASALFEKEFLGSVQWFLEKGEKALNLLQQSDYAALREEALKEGCVCHGEYNQHNVFFRREEQPPPTLDISALISRSATCTASCGKFWKNTVGM